MAAAFGLDLGRTLGVLHATTTTNGQLKANRPDKVLPRSMEPGFAMAPASKDPSLIIGAANAAHVPRAASIRRQHLNVCFPP